MNNILFKNGRGGGIALRLVGRLMRNLTNSEDSHYSTTIEELHVRWYLGLRECALNSKRVHVSKGLVLKRTNEPYESPIQHPNKCWQEITYSPVQEVFKLVHRERMLLDGIVCRVLHTNKDPVSLDIESRDSRTPPRPRRWRRRRRRRRRRRWVVLVALFYIEVCVCVCVSHRIVENLQITSRLDDISACVHILLEEVIVHGDLEGRRLRLTRICGCCIGGSKVVVVVVFLFFTIDPVRPGSARLHRYQQDKDFCCWNRKGEIRKAQLNCNRLPNLCILCEIGWLSPASSSNTS